MNAALHRLWVRITAVFGFAGFAVFQLLVELAVATAEWWDEMRRMWPMFVETFSRGSCH